MDHNSNTNRVFVSHSWEDKSLARRISRRLQHRGVDVWLDEERMEIGSVLPADIREAIAGSSHFLLLWTKDASASKWVAKELAFARDASPGPAILPLLYGHKAEGTSIKDINAISIDDPYAFESELDRIAVVIRGKFVEAPGEKGLMRQHLKLVDKEAPLLSGMIQLLSDGEFRYPQIDSFSVTEAVKHDVEFALITLYELTPAKSTWRFNVAYVAAVLFRRYAVGYAVLRHQVASEPMDGTQIVDFFRELSNRQPDPARVEAVITLFEAAVGRYAEQSKPAIGTADKKYSEFVVANFDQFSADQVDRVIVSTTTPWRGPGKATAYLSFELFKRVPDSPALRSQWFYWINGNRFCHKAGVEDPMSSEEFFALMNEAEAYTQFDEVMAYFEECFRELANEGSISALMRIAQVFDAASDTRYRRRRKLYQLVLQRSSRSEWVRIK